MPRPTGCSFRRSGSTATLRAIGAAALVFVSCTQSDPARAAAERFVDKYYVEIDLPAARDQAMGVGRAKIEKEMRLLEGVAAPESDAKPSVYYRFLAHKEGSTADRQGFLFELTISLAGTQITRRALVTMRREGEAWRAANFEELD
jgi:hypothetical protein